MTDLGSNTDQVSLQVSTAERRWVWRFAIVVMCFTTLPYWLGYARQGDAYRFTGFVYAVEDGNSYIAKMLSGTYGAWLFRSPYSPYPQRGVLMFLPYLLIGKLASAPGLHEQLVVLFHIFRFLAGLFAIHATYDFLAFFLNNLSIRRFGLALATLGGGLGWVLVLLGKGGWLGSLPLEFYSPETFGFLGLYGAPHLAMARAFLLLALLSYLQAISSLQPIPTLWIVKISVFWCLAGLMQPLSTLVIGFLLAIHLLGSAGWMMAVMRVKNRGRWARWRGKVRMVVLAGIVPSLLVVYHLYSLVTDSFLRLWTDQNILHSPHPAHYLLAFGLMIPFAFVGGYRIMQRDPFLGWLPVGWVISAPLLAYAPVNLQRRLPEGVWIAWILLAMIALESWKSGGIQLSRGRSFLLWIPFLFCFPSSLFLLVGGIQSARGTTQPVFRESAETSVFQTLGEMAGSGAVVLSAYETGNALTAWAPLRVVIGHGPESVNLADLRHEVTGFYSMDYTDEIRWDMICDLNVDYVFWGPAERSLGNWNPGQAAYLESITASGSYQVYQVTDYVLCTR